MKLKLHVNRLIKIRGLLNEELKLKSRPLHVQKPIDLYYGGADLEFYSSYLRHQRKLQVLMHVASASHGRVCSASIAFAGINLYCLVTAATGCEVLRSGNKDRNN